MSTNANNIETTQKSIPDRLTVVWAELTRNQRRFVVAVQDHATKAAAAVAVGLEPDTVYRWPDIVNEAIDLYSADITAAALDIILASAGKAAMVKTEALDAADIKVRQAAATEILDRALGKPTQREEVTTSVEFDLDEWIRKAERTRAQVAALEEPD